MEEEGRRGKIRTIVMAPSQALRLGLRALLQQDERIEVIAAVPDLSSLETPLFESQPDVIVEALGGESQPSIYPDIQFSFAQGEPFPAYLLLCDDPEAARSLSHLPFRALGILPEDTSAEEVAAAAVALAYGLSVGEPAWLRTLYSVEDGQPANLVFDGSEQGDLVDSLTPRETEILQLLAQGLPNKQIALALKISEHTVKFHISSIYSKLGATNRTEAVSRGARLGLVVF